jgi:hypothetical protein
MKQSSVSSPPQAVGQNGDIEIPFHSEKKLFTRFEM